MKTMTAGKTQSLPEGERAYTMHEAVAVFASEKALISAVDALEANGVDRAAVSVLAPQGAGVGLNEHFGSAEHLADAKDTPRSAYTSPDARTELGAAAVGLPLYVGSLGGLFAVVAAGGSMALALPIALAGGVAAGGLGLWGALTLSARHKAAIDAQIESGGLVLWVGLSQTVNRDDVLAILERMGGTHVHTHRAVRHWGIDEVPLSHTQPDPLLERAPI